MADPGLQIRGRGGGGDGYAVIQTLRNEKRGAQTPKFFFSALRASVWSKDKGGRGAMLKFQKNNFTRSEISQKRIEARYKNVAETRKC